MDVTKIALTRPAVVLVITMAILFAASGNLFGRVTAEPNSMFVNGQLAGTGLTGTECTSPVGICVQGQFIGGVQGTFILTVTTVLESPNSPPTGAIYNTADIVVDTRDGQIYMRQDGVFNNSEYIDLAAILTIVGGTGKFSGASGVIRSYGTFVNSCGDCRYEGRIKFQ